MAPGNYTTPLIASIIYIMFFPNNMWRRVSALLSLTACIKINTSKINASRINVKSRSADAMVLYLSFQELQCRSGACQSQVTKLESSFRARRRRKSVRENQRSSFDACSTSAKLLVQKARRAKARLSDPPRSIFGPEHSNENETARCEYYDGVDRTAIVGALQNSRTKSRAASTSNLEGSSCCRIKILRRRFNANDLETSLTEKDLPSEKPLQNTPLFLPLFLDRSIISNCRNCSNRS